MPREHEYDDNDIQNAMIIVKYQKYKTWLYVTLLTSKTYFVLFFIKLFYLFALVCLYILFYINLIKTQSTTIVISNITLDKFNELYSKHRETLSCPCSTITIPYENFTSTDVTIHSVCSSVFVDPEWIKALFAKEASQYGVWDFRTTAYSQVSQTVSFFKSLILSILVYTFVEFLFTFKRNHFSNAD